MEHSTQTARQTKWWLILVLILFVLTMVWGDKLSSLTNSRPAPERLGLEASKPNPKPKPETKIMQAIQVSHLAAGLSTASMMKMAVAEYYAMNGVMPNSNKAVHLGEPEVYAEQALKSVRIKAGGIIELTYNIKSGVENGHIRLIPSAVPGLLKWSCETSDYLAIERFMPQCRYISVMKKGVMTSVANDKAIELVNPEDFFNKEVRQ